MAHARLPAWRVLVPVLGLAATATSAAAQPVTLTDLRQTEAQGRAGPGTVVVLFGNDSCAGAPIGVGVGDPQGRFTIPITPPATDTWYAARPSIPTVCSNPLRYHTIHRECPAVPADQPVTRPVIDYRWGTYNHLLGKAKGEPVTQRYLDDLASHPPALHLTGGFSGQTPIDTGLLGVAPGVNLDAAIQAPHVVEGDWTQAAPADYFQAGPLDPGLVDQRLAAIADFTSLFTGLAPTGIYIDFGTQLYGNPSQRTGFWAFYDRWKDYAGALDLGPQPADPATWRRAWWDPHGYQSPAYDGFPELMGQSFEYSPIKDTYGDGFRFAVNVLSPGWEQWWTSVVQWMARIGYPVAFVDNAFHRFCWNPECKQGWQAWVAQHYSAAERARYFTTASSRWANEHGFDGDARWVRHTDGSFSHLDLGSETGASLAPDADAPRGTYAVRVTALPGQAGVIVLPTFHVGGPLGPWRQSLSYRHACPTPIKVAIWTPWYDPYGPNDLEAWLPPSPTWTTGAVEFRVDATRPNPWYHVVRLTVPAGCTLWFDEPALTAPGETVALAEAMPEGADMLGRESTRLRWEATMRYWDSVVDDRTQFLVDAGRKIDPAFALAVNSAGRQRRGTSYTMFEHLTVEGEAGLAFTGLPPGVYQPTSAACTPWSCAAGATPPANPCRCLKWSPLTSERLASNVFDYRHSHALRHADEFAYLLAHPYWPGSEHKHHVDSATLDLAEAAAFGGGAAIDLRTDYAYWDYADPVARTALLDRVASVRAWADAHADLFACVTTRDDWGLYYPGDRPNFTPPYTPPSRRMVELVEELAGRGLSYDVMTAGQLTLANLARHRVVLFHETEQLGAAEVAAIGAYLQGGGIVVISGDVGSHDEYYRWWASHPAPAWPPMSLTPGASYTIGAGSLHVLPTGGDLADLPAWVLAGDHLPTLSAAERARARVAVWAGPRRLIAHVVNYDVRLGAAPGQPTSTWLTDVEVRVRAPADWMPLTARIESPDGGYVGTAPVVINGDGTVSTTIPDVHIYSVVRFE